MVWTMWTVKSGATLVYRVRDRFLFSGVSRVLGLGLFPVLGWLKGITFVFDEDQRRILWSYSVEVRVARALTEIGEREVG